MTTSPENNSELIPVEKSPATEANTAPSSAETDAAREARLAAEAAELEADMKRMQELMPDVDFSDENSMMESDIRNLESSISLTEQMIGDLKQIRDDLKARLEKAQKSVQDIEDGYKKKQKESCKAFGAEVLPIFDALDRDLATITPEERKTSSQADKILTSLQKSCNIIRAEMLKFGVGASPQSATPQTQQAPSAPAAETTTTQAPANDAQTPQAQTAPEAPVDLAVKRAELEQKLEALLLEQKTLGGEQANLKKSIEEARKALDNRERILKGTEHLAIEKIVLKVIPSVDVAEKNLELISDQQRAEIPVMDKVSGQITGALKRLSDVFNKYGIAQENPLMKAFDENKHQALQAIEKDGVEPGTVVAVHQKGYLLHGHVMRNAQVFVTPS